MPVQNYTPIDCDFHDRIESLATLRRRVDVVHESDAGSEAVSEGIIADLYTAPTKEEFLRMDDGTRIRLDRIVSIRRADSGA
jgi:Rho-binding antiterminator